MFPSKEILRITVSRTTDGAADDGEIVTVGHSGSDGGCRGRHRHCRQFRAACLYASLTSAFLVPCIRTCASDAFGFGVDLPYDLNQNECDTLHYIFLLVYHHRIFYPHVYKCQQISQSNSEKESATDGHGAKAATRKCHSWLFRNLPSTILMAYLDVYCSFTLCLCMTITFLLSLVGPFAVPFRGISLRAHPSSGPACYAAGCPRRASIAWSVLATCISRMPPLHRSNDPRARSPPISAFYHPLSTSSW